MMSVEVLNQHAVLPFLVVKGSGPSLLGWNWLTELKLDWPKFLTVMREHSTCLQEILVRHEEVFAPGHLKVTEAKLHVPPESQPRFFKARPVPLEIQENFSNELDRLLKDEVLVLVTY